jgi:chemotaxis protein MotA
MARDGAKAGGRPDLATVGGLILAAAGILGGLILEGGEIKDISQITAALIVVGGTVGAVMISTPLEVLKGSLRGAREVMLDQATPRPAIVEELVAYATKARRDGIVALEKEAESASDPFLRKALTLAVDGTDLQELRKMLELEIGQREAQSEAEAKVFEAAGGYAPTIGIIGAVMGLIQVMKNLSDIDKVGHGIAVSFVATVYGVGLANILFLPMANKIKARAHERAQTSEMMLEGLIGIIEGLNPKLIRSKLDAFLTHAPGSGKTLQAEAAGADG